MTSGDDRELAFRPAVVGDALAVTSLHVETGRRTFRALLPQALRDAVTIESRLPRWLERIAGQDAALANVVWLATRGETIVGVCWVSLDEEGTTIPETGFVHVLYVRTEEAGRGTGTALLETGLATLRGAGCATALLWVLESNVAAQGFYRSRGWQPTGARATEIILGHAITELRYRTSLASGA